jgi:hypothetical protein
LLDDTHIPPIELLVEPDDFEDLYEDLHLRLRLLDDETDTETTLDLSE